MSANGMKRQRDIESNTIRVCTVGREDKNVAPITQSLESYLYPLPVSTFLSEIYQPSCKKNSSDEHQSKSFAVKVHPKLRERRLAVLKQMMHNFNPSKMLETSPTLEDGINVWLSELNNPKGKISSMKVADVAQSLMLYRSGAGLYFRASEILEDTLVPSYLAQLGHAPYFTSFFKGGKGPDGSRQRRGEIETFATHIGHTTNWHWDFQENFTVQLRGAKKWTFYNKKYRPSEGGSTSNGNQRAGATMETPYRASSIHFGSNGNTSFDREANRNNRMTTHMQHAVANADISTPFSPCCDDPGLLPPDIETACESVTVQPGDVLYHPGGVWHRVETVNDGSNDNSLSINISLFPLTWGQFVAETLQQYFVRDALWRQRITLPLPPTTSKTSGNELLESARFQLRQRLYRLTDDIRGGALSESDMIPSELAVTSLEHIQCVFIPGDGSVRIVGPFDTSPTPEAVTPASKKNRRNPLTVLTYTSGETPSKPAGDDDDADEILDELCELDLPSLPCATSGVPPSDHEVFQQSHHSSSCGDKHNSSNDCDSDTSSYNDTEDEDDEDDSRFPLRRQLKNVLTSTKCDPRDVVRFDLHSNFVGDSDNSVMISLIHCAFFVHRRFLHTMHSLATKSPTAVSTNGIDDSVGAGEKSLDSAKLFSILVHLGYLTTL